MRVPSRWRGPLAFSVLVGFAVTSAEAAPPGPLKEWPCPVPFADRIAPDGVWPGPLPAPLPEGSKWKEDAKLKKLVEFIASTENSPASGSRTIDDFATENGPFSADQAMLVLAGTVEQINVIRDFLIEGIHTQVVRSHILAEAVHENDLSLAAAIAEPSDAPERQPEAIRKARFWNLRSLDDVGDTAEALCRRYSYDERKAKALAEALARHTK